MTNPGRPRSPGSRLIDFLCWHRSTVQAMLDGIVWAVALVVTTVLRYDFQSIPLSGFVAIIPLAILSQAVSGLLLGLYFGRWRFGRFEEVAGMVRSVVLVTALVYGLNAWVVGHMVLPRSAILIAGVFAAGGMGGIRYGWRLMLEARRRPKEESAEPVVLFGAVLRSLSEDRLSGRGSARPSGSAITNLAPS